MRRVVKHSRALLLVLAMFAHTARTQEKDPRVNTPVQPYPPLSTQESSSKASNDTGDSNVSGAKTLMPDTHPLTGAQQFTLGSIGGRPKYLLSHLHFTEMADTNPSGPSASGTRVDSGSQLSGDISLRWAGSTSDFALGYAVGGTLYNTRSEFNQSFHQASLNQQFTWSRWGLLLSDQASYLPESSFGFGGFNAGGTPVPGFGGAGSGLIGPGGPFTNLNPILYPNQSILTGQARRISNVSVGQVHYSFSPRTSLNATASYGFLHFLDPGFIDSNQAMFNLGVNHALNSHDTLGIIFGYSRFAFRGTDRKIENYIVNFAYGRRITGRLALQFTAGPRITTFRNTPTDPGATVAWNAGIAMNYAWRRENLRLLYFRGVTGGSGLFEGASSDNVEAGLDRRLSPRWSGGLDVGYARNDALAETNVGLTNFHFRSMHGGAHLSRPLGRQTGLSIEYRIERQVAENAVCIAVGNCGRKFLRHQFVLSFDWSFRQLRLE